jgi:uncharacterized membrane protein YdjX (TVP38/TMEM64 family)
MYHCILFFALFLNVIWVEWVDRSGNICAFAFIIFFASVTHFAIPTVIDVTGKGYVCAYMIKRG